MRELIKEATNADVIATAVAVFSLCVSVLVLWRQRVAAGRANFTAVWESANSVVLTNHGPGSARDVHGKLTNTAALGVLEAPYMGPFQTARIQSFRAWGQEESTNLELSWRDNRLRVQQVTIYLGDPPERPNRTQPREPLEKAVQAIAKQEAEAAIKQAFRRGH